MVLLRMRFVQIKMRRTKRGSADPGRETRARSTIIGVGNNVGIGVREWFFVSMTYAVWCARRDSNPHDVTHCHLKAARLPIPPRALKEIGTGIAPDRVNGAGWNKSRE